VQDVVDRLGAVELEDRACAVAQRLELVVIGRRGRRGLRGNGLAEDVRDRDRHLLGELVRRGELAHHVRSAQLVLELLDPPAAVALA
jgi:hypothetical protein